MFGRVVGTLALIMVVGCGSTEQPINANSESISYTIADESEALAEVAVKAEAHCAQFERVAVLQSSDVVDGSERLVIFDCVEGEIEPAMEDEEESE